MKGPCWLVFVLILVACSRTTESPPAQGWTGASPEPGSAVPAATGGPAMNLPKQAGAWSRPETPRRITAQTIFDYMDGAGELYVGYRFGHLDVYEYTCLLYTSPSPRD